MIYAAWIFNIDSYNLPDILWSLSAALLFCAALAFSPKSAVGTRDAHPREHIYVYIGSACWVILVNAIFIRWAMYKSPNAELNQALANIWYNTIDANNYAAIAKNWYFITDGDPLPYRIVFFPLYAIIIRFVHIFTGGYPLAGMVTSSVCAYFSGILLYRYAKKTSVPSPVAAVAFLFTLPSAFFLMVPMTESMFLLLTIACFYFLHDKKYLYAGIMGFLAALTRSQGFLLAIPIAIELLSDILNDRKNIKKYLRNTVFIAAPLFGTGIYLLINIQIYGIAFKFMEFQREHWHQNLSFFWKTAAYLPAYMSGYAESGNSRIVMGLSIPNIAAIFGGLLLLLHGAKKHPHSVTIWALAYFAMSMGPSWLLSGPRYLCCLFPLALSAAHITPRYIRGGMLVIFIIGFVLYLYAFINRFYVY